MGVVCVENKNRRKIVQEQMGDNFLNTIKETLLNINDNEYSCTKCKQIPQLKEIDCNNQNIVFECSKHGRILLGIETYLKQFSENNCCYYRKCTICKKTMKDNSDLAFYHCFKDDKDYCQNDIPKNFNISLLNNSEKSSNKFCGTCNYNIPSNIDHQAQFNNTVKHEVIAREEYKPDNNDVKLLKLFEKLLSLIITSYEKQPDNYYYCINAKSTANFLKKSSNVGPKVSKNDKDYEKKIMEFFGSIEEKKIQYFNQLYNSNIKGNEKTINLRDKKIGNLGLKLLTKMNLRNCENLNLVNNDISNLDNSKFLNCYNLKALNLAHNYISDIGVFNKVHFSLNKLNLNSNIIEDFNKFKSDFIQLKNIKEINLLKNNFHNNNDKKNLLKLKGDMKIKNIIFKSEINEKYLKSIKYLASLREKYPINIKINDKVADLSSIKKDEFDVVLKQLMNPELKSLIINDNVSIDKFKKSCIDNIQNFPKLNSIEIKESNNKIYLRNDYSDNIFEGNIFDLKLKKELCKADNNFESVYTFVVFHSIKTKSINLIYFQTENGIPYIKLINDFDNIENKILHEFRKGIKLYEIKYYIDTKNQNETIITSSSDENNYIITIWKYENEKIKPINEKNVNLIKNNYYFFA